MSLIELARALTPVAAHAGAAILELYGRPIPIDAKADNSPVTEADRRAEEIILEGLSRICPEIPVVAEEASAAGATPVSDLSRFLLVDPLDGTKEFINRLDDFTVNIALIEDCVPRFGLVYAPARDLLFVTLAGDRAIEATLVASEARTPLDERNARHITARPAPADGLVAVVSRSHMNEATREFLRRRAIAGTTSAGSSLKFALVARGDADVYPRLAPTMEWDTAAGHAVLRAAGGSVVTEDGAPLTYGKAERSFLNPGFIAWGAAAARSA